MGFVFAALLVYATGLYIQKFGINFKKDDKEDIAKYVEEKEGGNKRKTWMERKAWMVNTNNHDRVDIIQNVDRCCLVIFPLVYVIFVVIFILIKIY